MGYNNYNGSSGYSHNQENRQNQSFGHSAGGNNFQQNRISTPNTGSFNRSRQEENSRTFPDFDLKVITKKLFDETANECAKIIAFDGTKTDGSPKESANTATQLRRFYDEFEMWNERTVDEIAFKKNVPFVYMMKSKAAYALGRKNIDKTFQTFFNKLVNQVDENNIQTLHNAKLFFEAFMGFYKQYRVR